MTNMIRYAALGATALVGASLALYQASLAVRDFIRREAAEGVRLELLARAEQLVEILREPSMTKTRHGSSDDH